METCLKQNNFLYPNIKIQILLFFISIAFFLNFTSILFFIPFPIMLYLFYINIKTIEIDFNLICILFLAFINAGYSILFLVNLRLPAGLMYLFVLAFIIYTIAGGLVLRNFTLYLSEKSLFELFLVTSFLVSIFWYFILVYQNPNLIHEVTINNSTINILGNNLWGVNVFWACTTPFIYLVPFYIKRYKVSKKIGILLLCISLIMSIIMSSKFLMLFAIISFFIVYPLYSLLIFIPILIFSLFCHDEAAKVFIHSYNRILTLPQNARFKIWSLFISHIKEVGYLSSNLVKTLHDTPIMGIKNTSFHCFTMNLAASVGYIGAFLSFVYISIFLYLSAKAKLLYLGIIFIVALSTCIAGEDPHLIAVMIIFFYAIINYTKNRKVEQNSNLQNNR